MESMDNQVKTINEKPAKSKYKNLDVIFVDRFYGILICTSI